VFHPKGFNRFRQPSGFIPINRLGFSRNDGTEFTGPGTNIAKDHKGGSTGIPAFSNIRTIPALANGMQIVLFRQVLKVTVITTGRPLHPEPLGQSSHILFFHQDEILLTVQNYRFILKHSKSRVNGRIKSNLEWVVTNFRIEMKLWL
jgi:hypothetical protein